MGNFANPLKVGTQTNRRTHGETYGGVANNWGPKIALGNKAEY